MLHTYEAIVVVEGSPNEKIFLLGEFETAEAAQTKALDAIQRASQVGAYLVATHENIEFLIPGFRILRAGIRTFTAE